MAACPCRLFYCLAADSRTTPAQCAEHQAEKKIHCRRTYDGSLAYANPGYSGDPCIAWQPIARPCVWGLPQKNNQVIDYAQGKTERKNLT